MCESVANVFVIFLYCYCCCSVYLQTGYFGTNQTQTKSKCKITLLAERNKQRMSEYKEAHNAQSSILQLNPQRITGVVKFYSVQKCYGFIKRDDTKEYVFVHSKSVSGKNERRVTRSLAKGEHVEFDVVLSDRSPEAINVTGLNNEPVLGSEYALISMQWHQYNDYKRDLIRNGEYAAREQSPRARRFYHRKSMKTHGQPNRNQRKNRKVNDNKQDSNANATERSDDTNKASNTRRNRNRNRRTRKATADPKQHPNATDKGATSDDWNITTMLSELDLANNLASANSTSSESLDFEKINSEETALAMSNAAPLSASSRLAASFGKGNQ